MGGKKGTITGEKGKSGDKKKPISRSARAGLQFPVGRIHRLLKVSLRLGLVQPCTAVTCFGGRWSGRVAARIAAQEPLQRPAADALFFNRR